MSDIEGGLLDARVSTIGRYLAGLGIQLRIFALHNSLPELPTHPGPTRIAIDYTRVRMQEASNNDEAADLWRQVAVQVPQTQYVGNRACTVLDV